MTQRCSRCGEGRQGYLGQRVESLKTALDLAQQRIDELERAFGADSDLMPLRWMGLTEQQARIVHLLRSRPVVTTEQMLMAMYAENPDRRYDVQDGKIVSAQLSYARRVLRRVGVDILSAGKNSGYHMPPKSKGRLDRLIASKARVLMGRSSDMRMRFRRAAE